MSVYYLRQFKIDDFKKIGCNLEEKDDNTLHYHCGMQDYNGGNRKFYDVNISFNSEYFTIKNESSGFENGIRKETCNEIIIYYNKIGSFSSQLYTELNENQQSVYTFQIKCIDNNGNVKNLEYFVSEEMKEALLKFFNDRNVTPSKQINDKIDTELKLIQEQKRIEEEKNFKKGCLTIVIIILLFLGGCLASSGGGGSSPSYDWEEEAEKQGYKKENGKWNYEGDGAY